MEPHCKSYMKGMIYMIFNDSHLHVVKTTAQWKERAVEYWIVPRGCLCVELTPEGKTKLKVGEGNKYFRRLPYICDQGDLSKYYTKEEIDNLFNNLNRMAIVSTDVYDSKDDLPLTDNKLGDVRFVKSDDEDPTIFIWNGTKWISTKSDTDLSDYVTKPEFNVVKDKVDEIYPKAHTHPNKDILDSITQEDRDKFDSLHNYDDTEIRELIEETRHTHPNKALLDTITQSSLWSSSDRDKFNDLHNYDDTQVKFRLVTVEEKAHTHANKTVLDGITQEKLDEINYLVATYTIVRNDIHELQSKSHVHDNLNVLESTTAAYTIDQENELHRLSSIGVFLGAGPTWDGVFGYVPAPVVGQENYYLRGDGTWSEIIVDDGAEYVAGTGIEIIPDEITSTEFPFHVYATDVTQAIDYTITAGSNGLDATIPITVSAEGETDRTITITLGAALSEGESINYIDDSLPDLPLFTGKDNTISFGTTYPPAEMYILARDSTIPTKAIYNTGLLNVEQDLLDPSHLTFETVDGDIDITLPATEYTAGTGIQIGGNIIYNRNRNIPSDTYRQVEYLTSDGTGYILTDIVPTYQTCYQFRYRGSSDNTFPTGAVFGETAIVNGQYRNSQAFFDYYNGELRACVLSGNDSAYGFYPSSVASQIFQHDMVINFANASNNQYALYTTDYIGDGEFANDTFVQLVSTGNNGKGTTAQALALFAVNTYDVTNDVRTFENRRGGRFYYLNKMEGGLDDSRTTHYLLPCYRISDDTYGVYDIKNQVFYPVNDNAGFTVGNDLVDVVPVEGSVISAKIGKGLSIDQTYGNITNAGVVDVKQSEENPSTLTVEFVGSQKTITLPGSDYVEGDAISIDHPQISSTITHVKWVLLNTRNRSSAGDIIQVGEFELYDMDDQLITYSSISATFSNGGTPAYGADQYQQTPDKLIDGDSSRKMCCTNFTTSSLGLEITMELMNPIDIRDIKQYRYITANDIDARDPVTWDLYVSSDGTDWALADRQVNDSTIPTARETSTAYYEIAHPTTDDLAIGVKYGNGLRLDANGALEVVSSSILFNTPTNSTNPVPVSGSLSDYDYFTIVFSMNGANSDESSSAIVPAIAGSHYFLFQALDSVGSGDSMMFPAGVTITENTPGTISFNIGVNRGISIPSSGTDVSVVSAITAYIKMIIGHKS